MGGKRRDLAWHRLLIWIQNLHCIFLELCERPEYISVLREEIGSSGDLDFKTLTELPILDSFAKESARLNPLDKSMNLERVFLSSLILTACFQWQFAEKH